MYNLIERMKKSKKNYREHEAIINSLPEDYQFVFRKINEYIWSFAGGTGNDMLQTQYELAKLFEEAAKDGCPVLDVTGKDVAGFCDELIRGNKVWLDRSRKKLNDSVNKSKRD